ncbi:MAG TPA: hypothetical protein DDW27_01470 [Bacteroidales bacterium]|nr:hypothetical protein [Bacteroidales bacterium]
MTKLAKIIAVSVSALLLLILLLLFTVPVIFKEKIKTKVQQVISESINAKVNFKDYKLSFFRNFPDLSFGLDDLSVIGIDKFENDTLAGFKSFDLVFNLPSLFKKSGYEIKSIVIDRAMLYITYLEDNSFNWDIATDTATTATIEEEESTTSGMKILLKKVSVHNSLLQYTDKTLDVKAIINDLNFDLTGDMTLNETDLKIKLNAGDVNFIMEGIKYLNRAKANGELDLLANLDTYRFIFRENYLTINDLKINFTGWVEMPEDDISTDILFKSEQTSFKTLLSLIPAVYMNDFQNLNASGEFSLSGSAKGVYSDADSTMPDISVNLVVSNGLVSYPALPEKISNINIKADAYVDGKDMDKTTAGIEKFHMELAGNPFDVTFALKTPVSDPDIRGSMTGKIDLTALSNAIPLDSLNLSGIIEMSVKMAGRLSMIEKQQYDKFQASGNMGIKDMLVEMTGYPEVRINEAGFEFSPAYAALTGASLKIGENSDFQINGRLENYIPYLFKDETIKGNLVLRSNMVDASEILSKIIADTTEIEDTTALALIRIPQNIDFDFNALIHQFRYDKIKAGNVKGHILVKDGILSIRETGMNILGGLVTMNADYDTRDTLKPVMKADFSIQGIGVKDGFNTFNTIKKLAPAAQGVDGKVNLKLNYESLLGSNMMPLIKTISGGGKLQSDRITLVESAAYDKMKELLKLGENYTNTFRDLNVSFNIRAGRVYVDPFDVKAGNIRMNISGDQGIDQTMNYFIKTEIPRSELGGSVNSFIDGISAQASALGFAFKMPSDVMKINVRITGVFGKPIVTLVFGSGTGESVTGIKASVTETVRENATKAIDEGKEKLRTEAEARGDRLIKEAEEKAQMLRDEAAKSAETIRKEADLQAQKLVDEASSKGPVAKLAAQKAADTLRREADKKAAQLVQEADARAIKMVEEAKAQKEDLINKI